LTVTNADRERRDATQSDGTSERLFLLYYGFSLHVVRAFWQTLHSLGEKFWQFVVVIGSSCGVT
jgi:hypothetical protein